MTAKTPVRRVERPQQLCHRRDVRAIAEGHVVAAEDHQIGRRRLRQPHRVLDVRRRHERAVVNVGEEGDAQPVVDGIEARERQLRRGELELMAFVHRTVGEAAYAETDAAVDERRQHAATRELHWSSDPGLYSTG